MNGTTEPATAASAATQTTETVKMNGTTKTTTTDAGLFGDELISPEVAKALPEGYKIRALRQSDFNAGFLDCLRVLTTVGDITEAAFAERFAWLSRQDGGYYILVIEDGGRVVGTGALIVERKLYVAPFSPRSAVSIAQ
jgi:glucosamine-phosphate N-acetyltransferase